MTQRDVRLAWWLFGCVFCLYVLCAGGHPYSSDTHQKFAALVAMAERGSVAVDTGWVDGRGGLRYSWFPLGGSLVMAPGYLIGRLLSTFVPWIPAHDIERFVVSFQNCAFSAALVAAVFVAGRLLGHRARPAVATALALGLATMVWPYAKSSWSEPPATLALFVGYVALWWGLGGLGRGRVASLPLWVASGSLAWAVLIRQELALTLVGGATWVWLTRQTRPPLALSHWVALIVPLASALTLHLAYEYARYDTWLSLPNYRLPSAASGTLGVGVLADRLYRYTLSPNQGLLPFSPAVLLGLAGVVAWSRRAPAVASLFALTLAPLLAFYVIGWGPSSWAWGMRYAYVFLPFLMLPAGEVFERSLPLWGRGVLGLGVAVQLLAVPYDFGYLYERELATKAGSRIHDIMTDPGRGPLVLAWRALPELGAGRGGAWTPPRAERPALRALRQARAEMEPDFWWWLYRRAGVPFAVLALLAAAVAAASLAFGAMLALALRSDPAPDDEAAVGERTLA